MISVHYSRSILYDYILTHLFLLRRKPARGAVTRKSLILAPLKATTMKGIRREILEVTEGGMMTMELALATAKTMGTMATKVVVAGMMSKLKESRRTTLPPFGEARLSGCVCKH